MTEPLQMCFDFGPPTKNEMDVMRATLLPIIRRVIPGTIANDIVGVQPIGQQSREVIIRDMMEALDEIALKLLTLGFDDASNALVISRLNYKNCIAHGRGSIRQRTPISIMEAESILRTVGLDDDAIALYTIIENMGIIQSTEPYKLLTPITPSESILGQIFTTRYSFAAAQTP